jgi:C_GCAxxG_C_C family probable redox protein
MGKSEIIENSVRIIEHYRSLGYACAESSIRTLADLFDCPLPRDIIKAASIFSGGAAVDGRCGVAEAALIFVAYLFGGNESTSVRRDCARLVQNNMIDDLGSVMCSDLFYPLYEKHKSQDEPEEAFHCVFDSGIACVSGTVYDLLYTFSGEVVSASGFKSVCGV